ncbi:hypothetical protein MNBD_DELTA03-381 [hydrothermal vent metagenome]|uniref:Uncharacterized protein n=1 Tax=hydrothermal vent metagenome TaxID=652676 RepID=A0A3B0UXY0_9ZZZZ
MTADSLQQSKDILTNIREYLRVEKEALLNLLRDPRITIWKNIDIIAIEGNLKVMGISSQELQKALQGYPRQAKGAAVHIKLCNNEVSNQLADLIDCRNPESALQAALQLKKKSRQLAALLSSLHQLTDKFFSADQKIRQLLSFENILPLARHITSQQPHIFKEGLEVYRLLTVSAETKDDGPPGIAALSSQAAQLQSRFQHVDILNFPRPVEEILYHYLELGSKTIEQLLIFNNKTAGILSVDQESIKTLNRRFPELAALENTEELLNGVLQQAAAVYRLLSDLYHKRETVKTCAKIAESLEFLNIYHLTLKNKIIPALQDEIKKNNSPVNPATLSSKKTRDFFTGPKGIIRSMKLMVTSLKGHHALNQVELQIILEKAVKSCKTTHVSTNKEGRELRDFIDSLINHFSRPFPYDVIFTLVKQTITAYGQAAEKMVKDYGVKKNLQNIASVKLPASFEKLALLLEKKQKSFIKANQGG